MYDYNAGNYEQAENGFLSFVEAYPDNASADVAMLRAGLAAAKRKEYVRSVELLADLVKRYPNSRKVAEARFAQAEALSVLGKEPEAILIFDEIINKYADSGLVPAAWARKGDCQFTLGKDDARRYEESMASHRVVVSSSGAALDLVLQSEYMVGRCLEKLERPTEAFDQYYLNVILKYLEGRDAGQWYSEAAKLWFTRAAFSAADIMEARKDWRRVVSILQRVVDSGVPAADEAGERIARVRAERWWLFY
jgi:tetratricopeptide (TPR) repeat protein